MTNYLYNQENGKIYSYTVNHTKHSKKRASQRGLTNEHIFAALDYGIPIFRQGCIFYVVLKNKLPDNMRHDLKEKLDNIVVIISAEASILTCYKANNAIKYIKRKRKENSKKSFPKY